MPNRWTVQTSPFRSSAGSTEGQSGCPSQLVAWCLARPLDVGALATLATYWLGVRATELTSRTARDLDAGATLLDITDAKTEAGDRTLRLPVKLQPLMSAMADGKLGVSGVQLAQAMGHESETTTTDHYAGRGAVANAGIDRVARLVH